MIKKLLTRKSSIVEATVVLAVASLVSRLFGLIRDRTLFSHFGAGDVLDAYFAAFKIPDMIFSLLILGALSSAFIPIFTDYLTKDQEDRREAWALVNTLINLGMIILAVILLLGIMFAPTLAGWVAPGFEGEKREWVIQLMRVMLLSPLFFGLSNLAGGILNSFKNYYAYAVAPILYNVGIIVGVIYFYPQYGIIGLAYGVVLGAFLHLLIQVPGVFRFGYRYSFHLNMRHAGVRQMAALMAPRTLGLAVAQIGSLVGMILASPLGSGSVAVLAAGDSLISLPVSIFGVSFAVAVFPVLAEKYSLKKLDEFRDDFVRVLRSIIFFTVPTMMGYILLRAQIVRLVYGTGEFSWDDTRFTVSVLAFLTFGMIAQATIPLLARSFYALKDTKTPLITGVVSLIVNYIMAVHLVQHLNVVGIAFAISIAALVNMILLFAFLHVRLDGLPWGKIGLYVVQLMIASVVMGGVGYAMLRVMDWIVNTQTILGLLLQTVFTIAVSGLTYLAVVRLLGVPEVAVINKPLKSLFRK